LKKCKFILMGVLILATLSCSIFSSDKINEEQRVYENDAFSFTIPSGWEMALFGGDFYDLNVEMVVTVYENPIMFWSKALFTVASSPLDGDLETRFTQTYENVELYDTPTMEVKTQGFEKGVLSGLEIFYSHQYGEKIYSFHDIWLEEDGYVFVLSFYTRPSEFNNYTVVFDQILESFRFKE
jgi:Phr family secreted Rap phosphatase inhibitor